MLGLSGIVLLLKTGLILRVKEDCLEFLKAYSVVSRNVVFLNHLAQLFHRMFLAQLLKCDSDVISGDLISFVGVKLVENCPQPLVR